MESILNRLKSQCNRASTCNSYLSVWRRFNKFVIQLDNKPEDWEDRVSLFLAYLIKGGAQSASIRSYVSAIKKVLVNDGYAWRDEKILLTTLTRSCRLVNDKVKMRLPIQSGLLELILFEVIRKFQDKQPYLKTLYMAIFALGYYGLFRIGELCWTPENPMHHTVKASNIHVATNKEKILAVLYTSKTHGKESFPQKVKITSNKECLKRVVKRNFCPFKILKKYIETRHQHTVNDDEVFFIYRDRTPVQASTVRNLLKDLISNLGL